MTKIINAWPLIELGDIIDVIKELVAPSELPYFSNYIGLEHISSGGGISSVGDPNSVSSTKAKFQSGDILYGRLRPYLNKVVIAKFSGICSTDILVLRPRDKFTGKFIYHTLRSKDFIQYAQSNSYGVNLPRIKANDIKAYPLRVPPLEEQKRIVAKIEALQARTRKAREALAKVGPLLEKLKHQVLAAAFRGDLTAQWRADNPDVEPAAKLLERIREERRKAWEQAELAKMAAKGKTPKNDKWKSRYKQPIETGHIWGPKHPNNWSLATIDEISYLVEYGTSFKTDSFSDVPVLRMGNITDGLLTFENLRFLPSTHHEFPALLLNKGDLLFNRTNSPELVGKSAIFYGDKAVSFASYLIRVRFIEVASAYICYFLNSPFGRRWGSSEVTQQTGQANINGTKLKSLTLAIPSLSEQTKILEILDSNFEHIQSVQERIKTLIHQLDQLDEAILEKAFRGELVPQDPNDEPASVLLERIAAEKKAREAAKPKRTRRKATPKI